MITSLLLPKLKLNNVNRGQVLCAARKQQALDLLLVGVSFLPAPHLHLSAAYTNSVHAYLKW